MRVLGSLGFYSTYIKNLHVDCKPFYDLIKEETVFKWTPEHEALFQDIKSRLSQDTILAIPKAEYPFHVNVVDPVNMESGSHMELFRLILYFNFC